MAANAMQLQAAAQAKPLGEAWVRLAGIGQGEAGVGWDGWWTRRWNAYDPSEGIWTVSSARTHTVMIPCRRLCT
jgi:hypothetical protein